MRPPPDPTSEPSPVLAAKIRFGGNRRPRETNQGHPAGLRPARAVGGKANRKWSRGKKGRRSSSTSR